MANDTPPYAQSSNFPWVLGAGIVGSICAGLTFLLTQSPALATLFAAAVVLSLFLGWICASWLQEVPVGASLAGLQEQAQNEPSRQAVRFARKAIEATPTPVIVLDENSMVIMTNQAARARFSIGTQRARFATLIRRPDLLEAVDLVLQTREPVTLAIRTHVPVDLYERASLAAFDVSGATFVMLSLTDETEVRQSERMRADFLANASHELRTPLAAIIGFIETLRGPARDDPMARDRFLEVMQAQGERMSRLISDLLALSRIELNEHVPPTGSGDMALIVQEAINSLPPKQQKQINLTISAQPIWVQGDSDEMTQVVTNLLDNALKYGEPQEKVVVNVQGNLSREDALSFCMRQWDDAARLTLSTPDVRPDQNFAALRVENGGAGIERQFLPRLSERFFRVEEKASGTSGTGLGLAIVKHIMSRHRGGLTVESEVGRGAAFSIYVPMASDPVEGVTKVS
jgi:two-component system, OmpR family, phosphate regulon sensor histidine kinase PhoR